MKKPNRKQPIRKSKKNPKDNIIFNSEYKITKLNQTKLKLISLNRF